MDPSSLSLISSFLGTNNTTNTNTNTNTNTDNNTNINTNTNNNDNNNNESNSNSNTDVNNRKCYMSLLCNDSYLPGVSVLCKTIKRYNKYPIYVMVSNDVSETTCNRLTTICDGIIHVPTISSQYSDKTVSWDNSAYTKLNLWNMIEFDKIVYIDADAMLISSTDELFDLNTEFAAAPDIFPPDKFNAGVLVIKPNKDIYHDMIEKITILSSYDGGDTGFLNAFFPNWYLGDNNTRLPFGYNAQRTMYWFTHEKRPGYWDSIKNLKIIHYSSSPKPWESGIKLGELELLWWSNL